MKESQRGLLVIGVEEGIAGVEVAATIDVVETAEEEVAAPEKVVETIAVVATIDVVVEGETEEEEIEGMDETIDDLEKTNRQRGSQLGLNRHKEL